MDRRHLLGLLASPALVPLARASGGSRTVRLPNNSTNPDPQLAYVADLIRLALTKVGAAVDVRLVPLEMQQSRSMAELVAGRAQYDLMWSMTTRARERSGLRVIRFPIDRGLLGWRLLLVKSRDLERWGRVESLSELRQYIAGQGHDWPDVDILKANGLPVVTSHNYDSLFRMLKVGRFDYLPRSILEVDAEMADGRHPDLSLVPDLMLRYPATAYLFVSPSQGALASDLDRGLRQAATDGSFQALFKVHFGALIEAHPVQSSRVLQLMNPDGPDANATDLWLRPGAGAG